MLEGSALRDDRRSSRARRFRQEWGGGVSKWPWAIPLLAKNIADQAGAGGAFCGGGAGLQSAGSGPDSGEGVSAALEGVGGGSRGGQGHDAELHHDAAGERPYGGDDCGRADAEVVGGGQRSGDWAGGGGGFALGILGRYGVLHSGGRCAERGGPCGCAPQPGAGGEQVCAAGGGRRGVCGQPVLLDGERGADDGDAAGAAADE